MLVVPFIVTLAIFIFLYPVLNEEKVEELRDQALSEEGFVSGSDSRMASRNYDFLTVQLDLLMREQQTLRRSIDSLRLEKEQLEHMIEELDVVAEETMQRVAELPAEPIEQGEPEAEDTGQIAVLQQENAVVTQAADVVEEEQEPFAERVKSLLNLDEEELSPILVKLNNDQLVRLYKNAGNIQREKLLRSLNPDRAAVLMESIML